MQKAKVNDDDAIMAPWDVESATTIHGKIFEVFQLFWLVIYSIARSIFRCLVPSGFLPRKNIKNSRVLITGASNGIGRALAHRFAKENVVLFLWDIDENGLRKVAEECKANGAAEVNISRVDVSSREAIFEEADKLGREIDILVNNAGILTGKFFLETSDDKISKVVDVNLKANLWTVKAFLPSMVEKDSGHIVAICSLGSFVGAPGMVDYCAAKFGAVGFMEALQNEMVVIGKRGIHFTYVSPAFVNTKMISNLGAPTSMDILDPAYVAETVMEAVLTNQKLLLMPKLMYFLYALKGLLPTNLFQTLVLFRAVR